MKEKQKICNLIILIVDLDAMSHAYNPKMIVNYMNYKHILIKFSEKKERNCDSLYRGILGHPMPNLKGDSTFSSLTSQPPWGKGCAAGMLHPLMHSFTAGHKDRAEWL